MLASDMHLSKNLLSLFICADHFVQAARPLVIEAISALALGDEDKTLVYNSWAHHVGLDQPSPATAAAALQSPQPEPGAPAPSAQWRPPA